MVQHAQTIRWVSVMFWKYLKIMKKAAQKLKFSVKDLASTCDQIRSSLRIWSHLLKKSFVENFIFCAVEDVSLFKS